MRPASASWDVRNSPPRRTQRTRRINHDRSTSHTECWLRVLRVLCGGDFRAALLTAPLRIAVIGVGHLGRHHARILAALPGVELAAVVDVNRARAEEIAAAHGTTAFVDYREAIGEVDAVTIAVPTE